MSRPAPIFRSLSNVSTVHGRPVIDYDGTPRWSIHRYQGPPQTCSLLSPSLAKKHLRLAQACSNLLMLGGKKGLACLYKAPFPPSSFLFFSSFFFAFGSFEHLTSSSQHIHNVINILTALFVNHRPSDSTCISTATLGRTRSRRQACSSGLLHDGTILPVKSC